MEAEKTQATQAVAAQPKSMGLAVLLTLIFGSLGMFYSTIVGGIVMTIVTVICLIITFLTLGLGGALFFIVWPIQLIWTVVAVNKYNNELIANN